MMAALNKIPGMQLQALLHGFVEVGRDFECLIQRLVLDSRQVQVADLFIAVPGHSVDGRQFIDDAVTQGASAVLWQAENGVVPIPINWRTSPGGGEVPVIAVENLNDKVGEIADRFYHEPSKNMLVVGITGTNGKTSCSQFIAQALGPKMACGVIGTMGWGFINNLHNSAHTTPDAITCHKWLADMQQAGATAVAMEVSSHALDQGRVNGVHFDCAVFTNLSHEHLDYHGDMQTYGAVKAKLFELADIRDCIINQDDECGRELIANLADRKKVTSYGMIREYGMPDIFADEVHMHQKGISATIHTKYGKAHLESELYGKFNIYNLLATLAVLFKAGLDFKSAMQRLDRIRSVLGRMQVIRNRQHPVVIIDYAHTPDALEQVLLAVKEHQFGKIWCVFGCGGDRDKSKRLLMGAIAEQGANQVVLTNDNPRHESEETIIEAIRSGMQVPEAAIVELDRKQAIQYALATAGVDDVVIIAGKGHENYQLVGNQKLAFSDFDVVHAIVSGRQQ